MRKIQFLVAPVAELHGFFLNPARPDVLETLSQVAWIHACRGADGAEIAVVVKQKFLGDASTRVGRDMLLAIGGATFLVLLGLAGV